MPQNVRVRDWIVASLLLVAVALIYAQTARHDFARGFDDDTYVYANPHIQQGIGLNSISWAFTAFHSANWHPLTWLSHALDWQLFGDNPAGHHIVNCLLQTIVTVLLLIAIHQATGRFWCAAIVAALFAVHPLHVESVAWIAERKDLLSGFFFMLTLLAYIHYARHRPSLWRYLTVVACFTMGLLAKPMLVSLPIVLLLLDYWPLRRWSPKPSSPAANSQDQSPKTQNLILEKLPLFLLAAGSCLMTLRAQQIAVVSMERISFVDRLSNAAVCYALYLGQYVYPQGLAVYYPAPSGARPLAQVLLAMFVMFGITVTAIAFRRRWPCLLVGWLWYLIMLLPVIGLVQVGMQSHADRYTYLPLLGPTLAVTIVLTDLTTSIRASRRMALGIIALGLALVLAALTAAAWQRTSDWSNTERLWKATIAAGCDGFFPRANLAKLAYARGDTAEAVAQAQSAVASDNGSPEAHNNLAVYLCRQGRYSEAISHYRTVLRYMPASAAVHANLALALAHTGEFQAALDECNTTLALDPARIQLLLDITDEAAAQGHIDAAISIAQQALANAQASGNQPLAAMIREHLQSYRAKNLK